MELACSLKTGLIVEPDLALAAQLHRRLACVLPAMTIRLAYNLKAARVGLTEFAPDVLLLAAELPDGDSLSLLAEQPLALARSRIALTVGRNQAEPVLPESWPCLDAYLLKDDAEERFMASLQDWLAGRHRLSVWQARRLLSRAQQAQAELAFTPRELDILTLLARGLQPAVLAPSLGLTRQALQQHLRAIAAKAEAAAVLAEVVI